MFIYVCIISGLQQELKQSQRRCQQVIMERETELQDLSHAVLSLRVSPLLPGGCEKQDGVGYELISKRPIMGRKVLESWTHHFSASVCCQTELCPGSGGGYGEDLQ